MKNENILHTIGNIRDDLIADAAIEDPPRRSRRPWAAVAACLCILLAGALVITNLPQTPDAPHLGGTTTAPEESTAPDNAPTYSVITLSDLAQLEQLRNMSTVEDEVTLRAYLSSLEGSDADSRQALLDFLALVDSIPVVQLIDGTVCRLSHKKGPVSDTGTYENILDLSFENQKGEEVRLEYLLSEDDIAAKEQEIQNTPGITAISQDIQIEATGDRLRVFGEKREPGSITWYLSVNGIYAQAQYRAQNASGVDTAQIFEGLSVIRISDLA